jgi:hypothetical protein
MAKAETGSVKSASLFRIIAIDIHFWIPLLVLVAGLVLCMSYADPGEDGEHSGGGHHR